MSEFLTYKKVSDLEQVNSPLEGATIPFLDGDGIVKRISADGFTSGGSGDFDEPIAPVFFRRSGNVMHYGPSGTNVTADEFMDAFFSGNGYFLSGASGSETFEKIVKFRISSNHMEQINSYISEVNIKCTEDELANAIDKYKATNKSISNTSRSISNGPALFRRSGNVMHYGPSGTNVTADEFMDAFFGGKAYFVSGASGSETFEQITSFRISSNQMTQINSFSSEVNIQCTKDELANAINKYKSL